MKLSPFELERYFARYEFTTPYLLCCSDIESLKMGEVLDLSDDRQKKQWDALSLGYTDSLGHPELRSVVAELYPGLGPDQICITVPQEGVLIGMNVLLKEGDHVVTTYPGYQSLYEIARSIGCSISEWVPRREDKWSFDLNQLAALMTSDTRLLVVNFPHNPTGSSVTRSEFREILGLAREKDVFVFSDEMYRFLEFDSRCTLESACELYPDSITLGGLSKSFALPGLRIGWLATSNKEIFQKIQEFKDYTTICSAAPAEILAIMALKARDKILDRNRRILENNLYRVNRFFQQQEKNFCYIEPRGGSICFPELVTGQAVGEFTDRLRRRKGVLLLPSSVYNFEGNFFRLGFGRKNLPLALEKLEEFMKESPVGQGEMRP